MCRDGAAALKIERDLAVSGRHQTFYVVSVSCSRALFALCRGNDPAYVVLAVFGSIISHFNDF
jgi:hypothetical protein